MSQARAASRFTQCDGKNQYATKRAAKMAARFAQRYAGGKLVPYRCRWCGLWHIGHAKPKSEMSA